MKTDGHPTALDARRELVAAGYVIGFSSPGRPRLWALPGAKAREHRAIANNGESWQIVPYPEPATCRPDELPALQARDTVFVDEEAEALEDLKRMGVVL